MFDVQREELMWGDRKLVLETGKVARQADGAVVATYGETSVLACVVGAKEPKAGIDFLPLTVNYQERAYAAGRIPGGYFKREGRPSGRRRWSPASSTGRSAPSLRRGLAQRHAGHGHGADPRPRERSGHRRHGGGLAALTLSGVPFMGPIGAARVGLHQRRLQAEPARHRDQGRILPRSRSSRGTQDAVLMVESEAKELSEDVMLGAVMFGHKHFQPVIEAIIRLAEKAAKEPRDFSPPENADVEKAVLDVCEARAARRLHQDRQAGALRAVDSREGEGDGRPLPRGRRKVPGREGQGRLQGGPVEGGPLEHPRHRLAHRRP